MLQAGDLSQGIVEYEYDELDRRTRTLFPDLAEVRHEYHWPDGDDEEFSTWATAPAASMLVVTHDQEGRVTRDVLDPYGLPLEHIDGLAGYTRYTYGAQNLLLDVEDPAGGHFSAHYDGFGRPILWSSPVGNPETYVWNAFDELQSSTDGNGRATTMGYDRLGRARTRNDSDGLTEWIYDGSGPNEIGQLVEARSPSGVVTRFGYELPRPDSNRGLPTSVERGIEGRTYLTESAYDDFSRLETLLYPEDESGARLTLTQHYDDFGHLVRVFDGTRNLWRLEEVDQGYRPKTESQGNGVVTRRTYWPLTGQMHTAELERPDATSVEQFEYS